MADSGLDCGQVVDQGKCWPVEEHTGRTIACPHLDAESVASLFSVPVLNGNAHRSNEEWLAHASTDVLVSIALKTSMEVERF